MSVVRDLVSQEVEKIRVGFELLALVRGIRHLLELVEGGEERVA